MTTDHEEFAESLRNILRKEEDKERENNRRKRQKSSDKDSRALQEMLEANFDMIFGMMDNEN